MMQKHLNELIDFYKVKDILFKGLKAKHIINKLIRYKGIIDPK